MAREAPRGRGVAVAQLTNHSLINRYRSIACCTNTDGLAVAVMEPTASKHHMLPSRPETPMVESWKRGTFHPL